MTEPDMAAWRAQARDWLASVLPRRSGQPTGPVDYAVFQNISLDAERDLLDKVRAYRRQRYDAGYGAIGLPAELTMFLIPMDAPGVEVRPIRQMSGASSFNEVFLSGVRVGDDMRVRPAGDGWKVANATLGFERTAGGQAQRRLGEPDAHRRDPAHDHRRARPGPAQDAARGQGHATTAEARAGPELTPRHSPAACLSRR